MREGADIGFLDRIFGFAVVAKDAARNAVEPAVIAPHDGAKCAAVAGKRAPHQFGILGRDGKFGDRCCYHGEIPLSVH